ATAAGVPAFAERVPAAPTIPAAVPGPGLPTGVVVPAVVATVVPAAGAIGAVPAAAGLVADRRVVPAALGDVVGVGGPRLVGLLPLRLVPEALVEGDDAVAVFVDHVELLHGLPGDAAPLRQLDLPVLVHVVVD